MKHVHGVLALAIVLVIAHVAAAGPWTPKQGHGQLIITTTVYETTAPFDMNQERHPFDLDGRFRKIEVNPYLEVGLTDRLALVVSAFASQQQFTNQVSAHAAHGLGDTTLQARYRMTADDARIGATVVSGAKLPTGKRTGTIRVADGQFDAELGIAVGGSLTRSSRPPFWHVDAVVRHRANAPADELKVELGVGTYVHRRVMLVGQAVVTKGLRNAAQETTGTNPTLSPDYDLIRMQASSIVPVTDAMRIQVGGFLHTHGRNTGSGGGVITSAWLFF